MDLGRFWLVWSKSFFLGRWWGSGTGHWGDPHPSGFHDHFKLLRSNQLEHIIDQGVCTSWNRFRFSKRAFTSKARQPSPASLIQLNFPQFPFQMLLCTVSCGGTIICSVNDVWPPPQEHISASGTAANSSLLLGMDNAPSSLLLSLTSFLRGTHTIGKSGLPITEGTKHATSPWECFLF